MNQIQDVALDKEQSWAEDEPESKEVSVGVCEEASQLLCLALSLICTDGGTQSRARRSDGTIGEYAKAMQSKATFPPVLVFYDGSKYWAIATQMPIDVGGEP